MELEKLETIARQLSEMLPESVWQGKDASEMEQEIQQVMSQLGNLVFGKHVMAQRIKEIEQGVEAGGSRCDECGGKHQVHERRVTIHPKSVFGELEVERTQ